MGYYNEADTRAKLIDPKVKLAGWGEGQIEREHYFVKGRAVTYGRIYLVGEESRRRQPSPVWSTSPASSPLPRHPATLQTAPQETSSRPRPFGIQ